MRMRALVLLFLIPWLGIGQDIKVRGQFLVDSLKIGQPVPFSLSASYPWERTVLFPDSTYDFKPFEFVAKQFFPTRTTNGVSYDSTVYYLNSFEIDSIQWLKLPVYVLQEKDCTEVWTQDNPVWLQHLVAINTDSVQAANLPLKVDAYYIPVDLLFNYPVASIIGGVALVLLIAGWFFFGKRIQKFFKVRRMRTAFEKYLLSFTEAVESLKNSYSINQAERALGIWKKYLESLEERPYTKYTSKEILQVVNNENLAHPLRTVDRLLYAGASPSSFDAFYELKSYSEDCFHKKLQEINSPAGRNFNATQRKIPMGLFDFLKKGNQKGNASEIDSEFTQQMIDVSSKCVERFQDRFKGLNFTVESLNVIDNILEEVNEFKEEMNDGQIDNVVQTVGSYVFEVARRNFGGRYFWYDQLNQPILVTGQPSFEISLLAFEKVKGRIKNGKEDNIPFFFQGYAERVKTAKPGDKAMIV